MSLDVNYIKQFVLIHVICVFSDNLVNSAAVSAKTRQQYNILASKKEGWKDDMLMLSKMYGRILAAS